MNHEAELRKLTLNLDQLMQAGQWQNALRKAAWTCATRGEAMNLLAPRFLE